MEPSSPLPSSRQPPIPLHPEAADNLSGVHSSWEDYGCPAGTFDHGQQDLTQGIRAGIEEIECWSEEEIQQKMMELQPSLLDPLMAHNGLLNTNGGLAVRSHAGTVPVMVQQSTRVDKLPHPQQQFPLPMNDSEAQPGPGGGLACLGLSLDDEVHLQQMTPTILPSQPPSATLVINLDPDEVNHMESQALGTLVPVAPRDQDDTPSRAVSQDHPSLLIQDGSDTLFVKGINVIREIGKHFGKMKKDEECRSSIVWQHFWRSYCKHCSTLSVICEHCYTVMRHPSTIELLKHLESVHNIHLLPASSRASKETQRSSQALQIREIAENPNGETDNSNCGTATPVDTQGTNAVVLCPWQPRRGVCDKQMANILLSQPCCEGQDKLAQPLWRFIGSYCGLDEPDSWKDLIIQLSDSSCCSPASTTKGTHDGFRLKVSNHEEAGGKIIQLHTSAAYLVHVSANPYRELGGVFIATDYHPFGSSYRTVRFLDFEWLPPAGFAYPWQRMHLVLCLLGFRKEFARDLVIYTIGWIDGCHLWLRSVHSRNNKGKSIVVVEQGDVPSPGKRKRKSGPPRSKVWDHFTKVVVKAKGSSATMASCNYCEYEPNADSAKQGTTMARCNYCGVKQNADPVTHGTSHLARHIRTRHPEHAKSL